ncbi:hypothetical protein TYRP_000928, partial [Tyrophagus putrescentiae]
MSRRKKFATLDEGQQQITSFFVKVPKPVAASVQATQPAVQQQITSFFGRVPRPGAAGVQATPPTLSPSMPVSRSLDVSSPPSQLSSHQFLPTAHVNDGVLSTMEKKEDDEEVVCGNKMDVDSCDDSVVKFVNPIYADDFGSSPHRKSAQLSEEEDEEEKELSLVLRRPNSKDVQKFKVDYDHYTESDEEDDDTYPTEFNRGEMESFLVEQQSSSKCSTFMKPLSGDELMPMDRRSISKKVQEFKERYDSDTESDEEDDDTYPTEFNHGEMESFLVEQQSSSKCTEFMKPLSEDELMPMDRRSISKKVQKFKERYASDTKSDEEDDDTYPTEFNQGEMASFLAEQQSSSKCTDFMRPLAEDELMPISGPLSKKSQKFQRQPDWDSDSEEESSSYTTVNNPNEMESFMEEQVKPLPPAINQQSIEIIEIDDEDDEVATSSAITYSSDNQETTLPIITNYMKIKDILIGCKQLTPEITDSVFSHKIKVKSIVELQYKNNNDKITRMLNEPLSQKMKDFVVQQFHHHYNSIQSAVLSN